MCQNNVHTYNKELVRKYPFLLPRNRWDDEVPEDYDYSYTELDAMPDGWRKAFGEKMCEEISDALTKDGALYDYRILQIKEKWGSLRWYDYGATDSVYQIVGRYESLSSKICINCGSPATKLTTGWIMPVCDECASKMEKRFNFKDIKEEEEAVDDLS